MKTWIKLYTEILRDPKMGRLTDRQYRTCMSLFLLAGEIDQEGALPSLEDIAWHLRMDKSQLDLDLTALASLNILTKDDAGWVVTRFADRQARNPSDQPEEVKRRVQAYRQRHSEPSNEPVTPCNANVTPSNDIEEKREEEKRREETVGVTSETQTKPAQKAAPSPLPSKPKRIIDHQTLSENEDLLQHYNAIRAGMSLPPEKFAPKNVERASVRSLIDHDYALNDLTACASALKAVQGVIPLPATRVSDHIETWILSGRPEAWPRKNGHRQLTPEELENERKALELTEQAYSNGLLTRTN